MQHIKKIEINKNVAWVVIIFELKNVIKLLCCTIVSLFLLLTIGCSESEKPVQWPPTASTVKPTTSKVSCKINGNGFVNLRKTVGALLTDGEIALPFNLFDADYPDDQAFGSRYEVTYFSPKSTRIKIDSTKSDKIAMDVNTNRIYFLTIGTQVRCGGKIYEVKKDGWYMDGKLAHKFPVKKDGWYMDGKLAHKFQKSGIPNNFMQ